MSRDKQRAVRTALALTAWLAIVPAIAAADAAAGTGECMDPKSRDHAAQQSAAPVAPAPGAPAADAAAPKAPGVAAQSADNVAPVAPVASAQPAGGPAPAAGPAPVAPAASAASAASSAAPSASVAPAASLGLAPDFKLRDTEGKEHSLSVYLAQGKTVVLEWFNPDCPFVQKHHRTYSTMTDLEKEVRAKGGVWLAINSAAVGLQGHGVERNRRAREDFGMTYPVLLDESGEVGRKYGAKTTPHMFVIAPDGNLVYRGAIDNERAAGKLGDTNYVRAALAALQAGKAPNVRESASYGCSVKYAAAN